MILEKEALYTKIDENITELAARLMSLSISLKTGEIELKELQNDLLDSSVDLFLASSSVEDFKAKILKKKPFLVLVK